MSDTPAFSSWSTNVKYGYASRQAGDLTLIQHRGVYFLLSDVLLPVEADSLAAAIAKADAHLPPEGWSLVVGMWLSRGWKIQKEEGGWGVFGEDGSRKSKQVFIRADLARKWAEVRADRVDINLRGPKPSQKAPKAALAERDPD